MLPMEPTHSDGGWHLVALDLGVNNGAVDGEVHEVLHSQDLGGDVLGRSIWKRRRLLPGGEKDTSQGLG